MITPKDVASYITKTIKKETGNNIDEIMVLGFIEDEMYDRYSELLNENDMNIIDNHEDDPDYFWNYCAEKIPNYYSILEEMVADFITEYLVPEETDSTPL